MGSGFFVAFFGRTAMPLLSIYLVRTLIIYNKFIFIEDDLYDYEEGSEEYEQVRSVVDAWGYMLEDLQQRVLEAAKKESHFPDSQSGQNILRQIEHFMQKHGYRDGRGWWVHI